MFFSFFIIFILFSFRVYKCLLHTRSRDGLQATNIAGAVSRLIQLWAGLSFFFRGLVGWNIILSERMQPFLYFQCILKKCTNARTRN